MYYFFFFFRQGRLSIRRLNLEIMSWLRNNQIAASFGTKRHSSSPPKTCDPLACTESFKKHWQQAREIIERTQVYPKLYFGLDQMLDLLNAHLCFL